MLLEENMVRAPTSEQMADEDELIREAVLTSREGLGLRTNPEAFAYSIFLC